MRRLLTPFVTAAALTLLIPLPARAACNATGTIPRVFIQAGVTN